MGTANRKLVYIDGDLVETKEGSVDYSLGGLEGTEVMSTSGYAGQEMTPKPGVVMMEVILNGNQNLAWWNKSIERDILVEEPDVLTGPRGAVFSGMRAKTIYSSSGSTAKLEFAGPEGVPNE